MVISLELLYQRLNEAEIALHRLMTGDREVTISVGDYGATTYARVNANELRDYITRLKCQIAVLERRPRRGPVYIRF